jgi:carboxyvinyl-carboxyphosphonate phosphorylmutase
VDALFLVGVDTREQLEAVAEAVDLPLMLGRTTRALNDADYLSARRVRVALQGHLPFMAAIRAVHDVLKSLREGKPPREITGSAPEDMVKSLTRDADYRRWLRDFLGG